MFVENELISLEVDSLEPRPAMTKGYSHGEESLSVGNVEFDISDGAEESMATDGPRLEEKILHGVTASSVEPAFLFMTSHAGILSPRVTREDSFWFHMHYNCSSGRPKFTPVLRVH
jgi:hypothetical protein